MPRTNTDSRLKALDEEIRREEEKTRALRAQRKEIERIRLREIREQEAADNEARASIIGRLILATKSTDPKRYAAIVDEIARTTTFKDERSLFGLPKTTASEIARIRRALLIGKPIVAAARRGDRTALDAAVARVSATSKNAKHLALLDPNSLDAAINGCADEDLVIPHAVRAARQRSTQLAALLGDRIAEDAAAGEPAIAERAIALAGRALRPGDRARLRSAIRGKAA